MLGDDKRRQYMLRISMPVLANKTCFIATPFDPSADDVSDCIAIEAANLNLQPLRTDRKKAHGQFIKDVYEGILGASVVVAVINNPVEHSKIGDQLFPNPNVMYELGIAHALGKPVIIVSEEKNVECIPADIRGFHLVTSRRNGGFDKDYFKKEIKSELERQLNRPYKHEFWEATIAETMVSDTPSTLDILENFKLAFDYGKLVHEKFHAVGSVHMNTLSKSTLELSHVAYSENSRNDIHENLMKDFTTNFAQYKLYYEKNIETLVTDSPDLTRNAKEKVSRSTETVTPDTKIRVNDLIDSLNNVQWSIETLPVDHRRVFDRARIAIEEKKGKDSAKNTDLYSAVKFLQAQCSMIVTYSDAYVKTLLSVFLRLYKERSSEQ